MTPKSVLFVTVNWNGGEMIKDCVDSFRTMSKPDRVKMVVVDNASDDGSVDFIETLGPANEVRLIRSNRNLGFGAACNLAVSESRRAGLIPDLIIFLNPDTRLRSDTLETLLVSPRLDEPSTGIVGIQLTDDAGIMKSCSNFPTALNFWIKYTGLSKLLKRFDWAQHHLIGFDHQKSREVDQVMGAFLMIRAPLFEKLGGFDERYFVYFEEVDLCLRCRKIGFAVWFEATSSAWHYGGGTTEQVGGFRLYLSLSSRLRFFRKNRSLLSYLCVLALTAIAEPIARTTRLLARRDFAQLGELKQAYGLVLTKGIK